MGRTSLLAFTPDGKTLVASSGQYSRISDEPSEISVWNLNSGNSRYTLSKPYTCAATSPDGQLLALGGQIEPLTVYRLQDGTSLRPIATKPSICDNLKFSTDKKLLVSESRPSQKSGTHIYNLEDGKLLRIISNREPYRDTQILTDIALSPNNRYLATSYNVAYEGSLFVIVPSIPKAFFGRIRIWNVETGRLVATLRGHWMGTNTITFSPDGKLLASAGTEDNQIRFWRVQPHDYTWLWLLSAGGLVALGYYVWFYLSGLANQSRAE